MAKALPGGMNYGHFGQATYSTEHGSWIFDRKPGHRGIFRQLGSWKTVLQPTNGLGSDRAGTSVPAYRARHAQHGARALGRESCDVVPSIDILPEFALLSAAVTSSVETFDPALGDLQSFGSVVTEGHSKIAKRVAKILIALPTGLNGNILRLTLLAKERQGWEQDRSIWLELLSISEGESGYWVGDSTPIQQLCFAHGEDRSAFLAVRLVSKTVLFRPIVRGSRKPVTRSPYYELPPSRVDPNPIITISLRQTGGEPHADVTFNPDYQRQLGIVDRKGKWSIWDIEGGHRYGTSYTLVSGARGVLSDLEDDPEDEENGVRNDGWARILWVGDVNTIVVCNRRRIGLYGIRGGEAAPLQCPQLIGERPTDWILDVRKHATNAHQLFLLTSTHLLLMAVTCQNDVVGYGDLVPGATVVLSWAHFRGLDDITLRLCVPALSEEESTVLLFSQLNNLTTIFQTQFHELDLACTISSSDPKSLVLADLFTFYNRRVHIRDLHMEPINYQQDKRQPSTGPGNAYFDRGITFYRLLVTLSDYSIHQALFCVTPASSNSDYHGPLFVTPPYWNHIVQSNAGDFQSTTLVEEEDDFVTLDGLHIENINTRGSSFRNGTWTRLVDRGLPEPLHSINEGRVLSYASLYQRIIAGVGPAFEEQPPTEMETLIDRIRQLLLREGVDEEDTNRTLMGTMFDLADGELVISDIDDSSSHLQDLVSAGAILPLRPPAHTESLALDNSEAITPTLSQIYDGLLESWIASLPTTVPSHIRRSKEELARRIAAETLLASHKGSPLIGRGTGSTAVADEYRQNRMQVPFDAPSSQITQSEADMILFDRGVLDPVAGLSHHLKFSKPSPTITPNIKQVLMHWKREVHPETYDWAATTEAVNEELGLDEKGDDEESLRIREKRRKKAERLLKRQRRHSNIGDRQAESQPVAGREIVGVTSSPPPQIQWGMSSQTEDISQSQSQSQNLPVGGGFVQSQVEPGRHGGRPLFKKKRKGKSRISGF